MRASSEQKANEFCFQPILIESWLKRHASACSVVQKDKYFTCENLFG